MTILSSKEEKFQVDKDNFHETDELLENRHARFVEPEEAQIRNTMAEKMRRDLHERKISQDKEKIEAAKRNRTDENGYTISSVTKTSLKRKASIH